jgi:hypothetical protein
VITHTLIDSSLSLALIDLHKPRHQSSWVVINDTTIFILDCVEDRFWPTSMTLWSIMVHIQYQNIHTLEFTYILQWLWSLQRAVSTISHFTKMRKHKFTLNLYIVFHYSIRDPVQYRVFIYPTCFFLLDTDSTLLIEGRITTSLRPRILRWINKLISLISQSRPGGGKVSGRFVTCDATGRLIIGWLTNMVACSRSTAQKTCTVLSS